MSENLPSEFTDAQIESIRTIAREVFGEIFNEAADACMEVIPGHADSGEG